MNDDKIIQLLRMTEQTDTMSDQQLAAFLNDKEVLAYYETMVWVKQSFQAGTNTPSYQLHEHWRRPLWMRYVATIVIALLAVTSFVVAAVYIWKGNSNETNKTAEITTPAPEKAQVVEENTAQVVMSKMTYENQTLGAILSDIAQYYGMDIHYANEDTPSLRLHFIWNPSDDIDSVIALFNHFDHIEIKRQGNTLYVKIED